MKFLARLEKKSFIWALIAICCVFIFLRLPSLIEPYWYGDEGIYEVIGQTMDQGKLLYRDIWDNKPPLLYVVYALSQGDQTIIKTVSLFVGIVTVIAFYFLTRKLFNKQKVSLAITFLFSLLFATPVLEANIANAENFILLPIILAGLIIYKYTIKNKSDQLTTNYQLPATFIAGLLLGVAFLLKIVAIFDLAAFLIFLVIIKLPENFSFNFLKKKNKHESGIRNYELWKKILIPDSLFIILGFLVPLLIAIIYFTLNGAVIDFFKAVFLGNVDYVGWKNNLFGIPQGWLLVKCLLLLISVCVIIIKRKQLTKPMLFILLWLVFSIFNAFFSGRPYTHYSIVLLPSFCLFVGLLFIDIAFKNKLKIFIGIILLVIVFNNQFSFNPLRSFAYYTNALQFITGQKSIIAYQTFFDQKVPRDYAIADFITTHTSTKDSVFIWGNNPQIYALSHKIPVGKYTVAYHILQNDAYKQTQSALNKKQPKYIIVLDEMQPLPFVIPLYIMRYNTSGATIYERSL